MAGVETRELAVNREFRVFACATVPAVGSDVGTKLGSDVGSGDGTLDGSGVGNAVGWNVGSVVGCSVGSGVGSGVGTKVGSGERMRQLIEKSKRGTGSLRSIASLQLLLCTSTYSSVA